VTHPSRGEVWQVDLNPTKGHEQQGVRPALVVSVDTFNHGPAGLVVVVPITTISKGIASHLRIDPPKGGATEIAYVKCEEIRCISKERFRRLRGTVDSKTMEEVAYRISHILGL
jgi:mRNA interferase MazF